MFPILDVNNRVIGFGGRVMGDGEPEIFELPETKILIRAGILYGLNFCENVQGEIYAGL